MGVKIVECPRDAMQGINTFIATEKKIAYINKILSVGFDTVDFGSFVSPKSIPQMRDTAEVLNGLNLQNTKSKLLAIVGNRKGAAEACSFDEITYLGFPFSISETFQQRNTNASINESLKRVDEIQNLCVQNDKELVVYISMAFGNPYGDEWGSEVAIKWTAQLAQRGIRIIALSDTIGVADTSTINELFTTLIPEFSSVEFGAHFHTTKSKWEEKVDAAYESGCRRFDGAIKGYGGCPLATDSLTGNMPTEKLIEYFLSKNTSLFYNEDMFKEAMLYAQQILG